MTSMKIFETNEGSIVVFFQKKNQINLGLLKVLNKSNILKDVF